MEITYLGHAGFRIRSKDGVVIIDPAPQPYGVALKGVSADIVCVTHSHTDHSFIDPIGGDPKIIRGPGEYEIGNMLITGVRTFHDTNRGAERGPNTVYVIHTEDISLCHLGDLGHDLDAKQIDQIGDIDVLMLPVGGHYTINAKTAVDIVSELDPRVIIPMHYATPALTEKGITLDSADVFCKALGTPLPDPLPKLSLTRTSMPAESQVVIFNPKG